MTMFFGYHPDSYWEVTESVRVSGGEVPLEAIDLAALVADLQGGAAAGQANETEHPLLSGGDAAGDANFMDASALAMEDPVDA